MNIAQKLVWTASRLHNTRYLSKHKASHFYRAVSNSSSQYLQNMNIEAFEIDNPRGLNFILGHAHFIETVDDLAECCVRHAIPRFGVAFCEASGPRKIRTEGNDESLVDLASRNALQIGAGHSFIIFIDGAFPISVLGSIKAAPTVASVHCATANPTTVLLGKLDNDRKAIIGVADGLCSTNLENQADKEERKDLLRKIGYKR